MFPYRLDLLQSFVDMSPRLTTRPMAHREDLCAWRPAQVTINIDTQDSIGLREATKTALFPSGNSLVNLVSILSN